MLRTIFTLSAFPLLIVAWSLTLRGKTYTQTGAYAHPCGCEASFVDGDCCLEFSDCCEHSSGSVCECDKCSTRNPSEMEANLLNGMEFESDFTTVTNCSGCIRCNRQNTYCDEVCCDEVCCDEVCCQYDRANVGCCFGTDLECLACEPIAGGSI